MSVSREAGHAGKSSKVGAVFERFILQPKDVEVSGRRGDLYGGRHPRF